MTTMGSARSRRLRLLESLRRTISDKLHQKVSSSNVAYGGFSPPENTSAIYQQAKHVAPDLLDQLFNVHQRTCEEQGQPMITSQRTGAQRSRTQADAVRGAGGGDEVADPIRVGRQSTVDSFP